MKIQKFTIDNMGAVGYISQEDRRDFELPPNAWTSADNVRFRNGSAQSYNGPLCYTKLSGHNHWTEAVSMMSGAEPRWLLFGDHEVRAVLPSELGCSGSPTENVVYAYEVPYPDNVWNVDVMYGNVVATSGMDVPIYYGWEQPPTQQMQPLPGWVDTFGPGSWCKTLISHGGFLLAGNIYGGEGHHPTRIAWSDQTQDVHGHGAQLPDSWDYTDPTKLAGSVWLPTDVGSIIAMKRLGDDVAVYCENAIYLLQFVGGDKIYDYRRIVENIGILGPHCVDEFMGNHVFVSRDGIYIFDGNTVKSIADGRVQNFVTSRISKGNANLVEVVSIHSTNEVGIFFNGDTRREGLTHGLIWSWEEDNWSTLRIPTVTDQESYYPVSGFAELAPGSYTTLIRSMSYIKSGDGGGGGVYSWDEVPYSVSWDSWSPEDRWGGAVKSAGDTSLFGFGYLAAIDPPDYDWLVDQYKPYLKWDLDSSESVHTAITTRPGTVLQWTLPDTAVTKAAPLHPESSNSVEFWGYAQNWQSSIISGQMDPMEEGTISFMMDLPDSSGVLREMGLIRWDAVHTRDVGLQLWAVPTESGWDLAIEDVEQKSPLSETRRDGMRLLAKDVTTGSSPVLVTIRWNRTKIQAYVNNTPHSLIDLNYKIQRIRSFAYGTVTGPLGYSDNQLGYGSRLDSILVWDRFMEHYYITLLSFSLFGQTTVAFDLVYEFGKSTEELLPRPAVSAMERTGLQLTDDESTAVILQVVPRMSASEVIEFWIGGQDNLEDPYEWHGPYIYAPKENPNESPFRINTRVRGRRHALRIICSRGSFRLFGADFLYTVSGER